MNDQPRLLLKTIDAKSLSLKLMAAQSLVALFSLLQLPIASVLVHAELTTISIVATLGEQILLRTLPKGCNGILSKQN